MKPAKPSVDLTASTASVNPSKLIHDNYTTLMSISDPVELKNAIINMVKPTVNHGFSVKNYQSFIKNLESSAVKGLQSIQFFLTNFMLKGGGLGVAESKIDSIASLINEDTTVQVSLTPYQRKLKLLVESYGYNVVIAESNTGEVESYVFYKGDGPVTQYVALFRTLEMVAQRKISPDAAIEFMISMNIVDVSDDQAGVDPDFMS